jgi:Lhr-like helicase
LGGVIEELSQGGKKAMKEGEGAGKTFDGRLHPLVLGAVSAYGIKQPSSIQLPLVDALRRGESFMVKSSSGTGKSTGAVLAFVDELARWDSECEAARTFQLLAIPSQRV